MSYKFTTNWFEVNSLNVWNALIPTLKITKVLEIGSYEGAATKYLVENVANKNPIEIHCIDTWLGGEEHSKDNMGSVESNFDNNLKHAQTLVKHEVELIKHKDFSHTAMVKLLSEGQAGTFDFIYIDGSHQAPDVILDAVLAFKLLKIGGVMIFDDYMWQNPITPDITHIPKPAIDAFTSLYWHKIELFRAAIAQIYLKKVAD